jgi:cysteine-rich repeat protein
MLRGMRSGWSTFAQWAGIAASVATWASCASTDTLIDDEGRTVGVGATGNASSGASGEGASGEGASDASGAGASSSGTGQGGAGGIDTNANTTASTTTGGGGTCGNGMVEPGEECDDGNTATSDGCNASCVIECNSNAIKNPTNGHCYRIFNVAVKAADAQAACAAWGGAPGLGNLVSIEDATEQGFVGQLTTVKAWMGAGDAAVEGTYVWYDGTPWNYENWAPNEPNDTTVEDCTFLQVGGQWDDHDCNDPRPAYLCERRGAGTF